MKRISFFTAAILLLPAQAIAGSTVTADDLNRAELARVTRRNQRAEAQANRLVYLNNSELALASRYLAISGARGSIDMTSLEWDPCSTSTKVLVKLLAQKANGDPKLPVRIMIDSYFQWNRGGKRLLSQMQSYYDSLGLEVKFFNPPDIGLTGGNEHTHSKLLLIDKDLPGRAKLVSGGRNMTDAYFGMAKESYIDRDVELSGPAAGESPQGAVAQASNGFESLWRNPMARPFDRAGAQDMKEFQSCVAWTPREAALEVYLKENAARIVSQGRKVRCDTVRYTIDGITGTEVKPTTQAVLEFLRRPQKTLTLENQYYIPTAEEAAIFEEKRRSVDINLYTNLFDGSEEKVVHYHGINVRDDNVGRQHNFGLARMYGLVDKWAFTPPDALYRIHAKTFVADSRDAAVSSFNIDPRSHGINAESGVFVYGCPAFARQVEESAQLTASTMTLEAEYARCASGYQAEAPTLDPLNFLIQVFSRGLQ